MFNESHNVAGGIRCAFDAHDAVWPPRAHLAAQPAIALHPLPHREMAGAFAAQTIDLALISPWTAFTIGGLRLLPGIGIVRGNTAQAEGAAPAAAEEELLAAYRGGMPEEALLQRWQVLTDRPLVWRVWACRARVPYPAIRRVMAAAHQAGTANATIPDHRSHQIASEESDALRYLLSLMQRHGHASAETEVIYC